MFTAKYAAMRFKDAKWHEERRRCEGFLNKSVLNFTTAVALGNFEGADRAYTDVLQVMDELVMLAGCEK